MGADRAQRVRHVGCLLHESRIQRHHDVARTGRTIAQHVHAHLGIGPPTTSGKSRPSPTELSDKTLERDLLLLNPPFDWGGGGFARLTADFTLTQPYCVAPTATDGRKPIRRVRLSL